MANRIISTEFPYWWVKGRPVEELSDHLADPDLLADWPCLVFYRGLSCYLFTHHERGHSPPDGVRPECRRIEDHYRLVPLVEARSPNKSCTAFHVPAEVITLGFYQLD
jgi:hypothetical protein